MNKYFSLLCCCLIFSSTCFAYTSCTNGTEITAVNGKKFCKSDALMTWYAAHAWCKANGGVMATMETACPGVTMGKTCSNMAVISSGGNVFGYIGRINNNNSYARLNLKGGATNFSTTLNRGIKHSETVSSQGEASPYGAIFDMYALCE